jgi:predicted DNA-binding transcriptional regulator YafY
VTRLTRKLRRVLFVIPYVANHPEGVPLVELATMLGATRRELEREIKSLLLVGVPQGSPGDFVDIFIEGRGPAARVFATPSRLLRRPPRLTPAECLALLLGASALRDTGIGMFDQALERASEKIRALLQAADGPALPGSPAVVIDRPGHERGEFLEVLSRASRAGKAVELDYSSVAGQKRKPIVVEPYGLLNHRGAWYVVGNSVTHGEGRVFVFKVERVLGATMLERPFAIPKTFDLRKYCGDRMFVAGLRPVGIRLRLRGGAARRLAGGFKNVRREVDGTVVVAFKDTPTGYLAAWVLRQGPEVEVLAPAELSSRVAALARRVAEAHATPATSLHLTHRDTSGNHNPGAN